MKCFFHETADAVATCQTCGKSLCKPCAAKYNPCACDDCVQIQSNQEVLTKKQRKQDALIDTNAELISAIIKGVLCSVILGFIFSVTSSTPLPFAMYVMFFFVPFGWAVITYIEQWLPAFLMSGPVFLIYMVIKLGISMMLGMVCFAFQIIVYVFKIFKANSHK